MAESSYDLRVVGVVEETADAHSVSFAPPAGVDFSYRPGQFLTLAVPSDQTGVAARCYSLSSSPHDGGPLTVTVKRTVDGYASNWICDHLREGSTIRSLPPSGIFTPASLDADLLLFAGGSGITPVMSITRTALAEGSGRIVLLYANRDERSVIFSRELSELAAAHPARLVVVHWLESVQGLPTQDQLRAFAEPFATHDAFVCGPAPFMKLTVAALKELGFPRERRHQEKFVSLGGNPFGDLDASPEEQAEAEHEIEEAEGEEPTDEPATASGEGATHLEVELDGQTYAYDDWAPGTKLLEHLEAKGVRAPYSCREGECSACAVRLLEGEVKMLHNDVLDDDDLADGIRLGCQSVPVTDVVRVTYS
ncbi:ferredoxin--NADP reductase [Nocardioides anomalus]|uniref:Ferredoxin--NADP reductase n=1 Tax=Nocardioides anomalus TaxID=2712223 RepID=A0A6G6WCL0_9ACTN|nr:ferredoxin--NADP reductase [Nocardioides anomalus]QIG43068.1 ferredoxin--NADP reductase [Nocardioides anomalus]